MDFRIHFHRHLGTLLKPTLRFYLLRRWRVEIRVKIPPIFSILCGVNANQFTSLFALEMNPDFFLFKLLKKVQRA